MGSNMGDMAVPLRVDVGIREAPAPPGHRRRGSQQARERVAVYVTDMAMCCLCPTGPLTR